MRSPLRPNNLPYGEMRSPLCLHYLPYDEMRRPLISKNLETSNNLWLKSLFMKRGTPDLQTLETIE